MVNLVKNIYKNFQRKEFPITFTPLPDQQKLKEIRKRERLEVFFKKTPTFFDNFSLEFFNLLMMAELPPKEPWYGKFLRVIAFWYFKVLNFLGVLEKTYTLEFREKKDFLLSPDLLIFHFLVNYLQKFTPRKKKFVFFRIIFKNKKTKNFHRKQLLKKYLKIIKKELQERKTNPKQIQKNNQRVYRYRPLFQLFERVAYLAEQKFHTPFLTPEMLFFALSENFEPKTFKFLKEFFPNNYIWELFHYDLLKKIYNEKLFSTKSVRRNQLPFFYSFRANFPKVTINRFFSVFTKTKNKKFHLQRKLTNRFFSEIHARFLYFFAKKKTKIQTIRLFEEYLLFIYLKKLSAQDEIENKN